jgi:hypothetical protein
MMIGRLRFPYRQRTAEAVLREDGRWECPEVPSLVRVLDTLYSPNRDSSKRPNRHLQLAARWLKGTVEANPDASARN